MLRAIGTIVAELRGAARLSREELAAAVRLPVAELGGFEETSKGLSIAAVDRLAAYFGVDPLALLRGEASIEDSPRAYFNQRGTQDFFAEDQPAVFNALQRAQSLLEVNEVLAEGPNLRLAVQPEPVGKTPYEDGYRLARKIRTLLNNEEDPLLRLGELLESNFSILIEDTSFQASRILALSMKKRSGAACVILNRTHTAFSSALWQRTNFAHELGHILFDQLTSGFDLVVDHDDSGRSAPEDNSPFEKRAKAFAAELLTPLAGLKKVLGKRVPANEETIALTRIREVREVFQTTYEVTLYQLINQGYIASSLKERLQKRWAAEQIHPLEGLHESTLAARVQQAWTKGLISDMRARELLGLSVWDSLPWQQAGAGTHAVSA